MTEAQQAQTALTLGWLAQGALVTGTQPELGNMKFYIAANLWPCHGAPLAAEEQREAATFYADQARLGWPSFPIAGIIAAGDSITRGAGSIDGFGYRTFLRTKLAQRGFDAVISLAGGDGLNLDAVKIAALAELAARPATKVLVFAAGTNDIAAASPTFQTRYAAAIDALLAANATVKIVVMKIPVPGDWVNSVAWDQTGGHPETYVASAAAINTAITSVVTARLPTGRVKLAEAVPSGYLANGGWHPTSRPGYLSMAWTISGVIPDAWLV